MIKFYFFITGSLFILFSFILLYLKSKNIRLTIEDYVYWKKIENKFTSFKEKIFYRVIFLWKEILFFIKRLIKKLLTRIKIEALKVENWANQRLDKLKEIN